MATNKVNMSLDDIIKQNKKVRQHHGKNRGYLNQRNRRNFGERRRYINKNNDSDNQNSYQNQTEEKRTRLFVSNLQKEVVNSELRKIFSSVGVLKKCAIHWDEMGFSMGTADVEYENADDAKKAIKDYNEAEVEGIQMKVEYYKRDASEHNPGRISNVTHERRFRINHRNNLRRFNRSEKTQIKLGRRNGILNLKNRRNKGDSILISN